MYLTNKTFDNFLTEFFGYNQKFNDVMSNIREDENAYILELVLPGFKKDEINIDIDGDTLKISSEVEKNQEGDLRIEYAKQSFEKAYYIPKEVNKDDISAQMENGILGIRLGKIVEKKLSKVIEIK